MKDSSSAVQCSAVQWHLAFSSCADTCLIFSISLDMNPISLAKNLPMSVRLGLNPISLAINFHQPGGEPHILYISIWLELGLDMFTTYSFSRLNPRVSLGLIIFTVIIQKFEDKKFSGIVWKICPREVPWIFKLSLGLGPWGSLINRGTSLIQFFFQTAPTDCLYHSRYNFFFLNNPPIFEVLISKERNIGAFCKNVELPWGGFCYNGATPSSFLVRFQL